MISNWHQGYLLDKDGRFRGSLDSGSDSDSFKTFDSDSDSESSLFKRLTIPAFLSELIPIPKWLKISVIPESIPESESPTYLLLDSMKEGYLYLTVFLPVQWFIRFPGWQVHNRAGIRNPFSYTIPLWIVICISVCIMIHRDKIWRLLKHFFRRCISSQSPMGKSFKVSWKVMICHDLHHNISER